MSGDELAAPPLRYVLSDDAARARGRAMALWAAAATSMPPVLVMVLVAEMQLAPVLVVAPIAALVLALGAARAVVGYRTTARRLRALAVELGAGVLAVTTARDSMRVTRADVERIVEVGGPLGGLRLELRPRAHDDSRAPASAADDLPSRVDLPRGGAAFGDLRAALQEWRPIERTRKRGRVARVAFGIAVVLAIFFLPFFVDDFVGRSRVAACAVILILWLTMRAAIARA